MVIVTAALLFVLIFTLHRINPINPGSLEGWIFQQDGAPPHTTKKVRDLLNEEFGSNYFAGGKRGAKLGLGLDLLTGLVASPPLEAISFGLVAFGPQLVIRLTDLLFLWSSGTSRLSGHLLQRGQV